jgi:hypothetical protein
MSVQVEMTFPGENINFQNVPGHWVLARLGKRVLRPGGMGLTRRMLKTLGISSHDNVVEFAPGMGVTAKLTLELKPASYTAVERDAAAARIVNGYLNGPWQVCVVGRAEETGLTSSSATVVYGEAMLTMQPEEKKRAIVREAHRLLEAGGRYGIHEMYLVSEDLNDDERKAAEKELTGVVHHGVRPLTLNEWRSLLESEGFHVEFASTAPMSLLEPARLIQDEGLAGAVRFAFNLLRHPDARRRVLQMRSVFRRNRKRLGAVTLTAIKK